MVQTSFFVALTAMVSIAGNVLAIPVQVSHQNLDARDESDHILEARMFKKLAQEIGKEVYTQGANAILHGPPAILQGQSNRPNTRILPKPPTSEKKPSTQNRPGLSIGKMEPIKVPKMAQKSSIGPISQALKEKGVDWSKSQAPGAVSDAVKHLNAQKGVKFDQNKVGKAKEAPAGKSSPKVDTGRHRSKEAPF